MDSFSLSIIGGVVVGAIVLFLEYRFFKSKKASRTNPDIFIHTPRNQDKIETIYGERKPIKRNIVGEITNITPEKIETLGLYVQVSIKTDRWYLQDKSSIQPDGKWRVVGRFGGTKHIIKASLIDSLGHIYKTREVEVTVIS